MENGSLQRRVLRDDVIDYFLRGILKKKYLPGDRLVEVQIAQDLNIGKGAVREAFRDLANMGYITIQPYKGAFINNLSYEEMMDYYKVRLMLEKTALEWIFDNQDLSGAELGQLGDAVETMAANCETGDTFTQIKADMEFHSILMNLAKSDFLKKSWESLGHSFWFFFVHNRVDLDMEKQLKKHRTLYEALISNNKELALEQMDYHFSENKRLFAE